MRKHTRFSLVTLMIPFVFLTIVWAGTLVIRGRFELFQEYSSRLTSVFFFVLSALAVGSLVLPRLKRSALLSFTTGLIIYYYLLFFLGFLRLYKQWILLLIFFLPAFVLLFRIRIRSLRRLLSSTIEVESREIPLVLIGCVVLFYSFLISLNPVMHYDALTNHLEIPAQYLMRQGIELIPFNLHANLPPASHMLHLILIACAGGESVQIFHFVVMLFLLLAFWEFTRNRLVWLSAALIFLLIPQVSLLFSLTNIDLLTTLFCVICFVLARNRARDAANAVLLGAHLAFVLSLKYQAAVFVLMVLFYLILTKQFRRAALAAAVTTVLVCPFLIKNYLYTQNPFFPFLSEFFPTSVITVEELRGFVQANQSRAGNWQAIPYLQTLYAVLTKQPETGLLVLLIPLVALTLRLVPASERWTLLAFSAIPFFALTFLTFNVVNVIRWLQPSWFFLSILGGACVVYWMDKTRVALPAFLVWIFVSFYLCFQFNVGLTRSFLVATGRMSEDQYRTLYIPSYGLRRQFSTLPGMILFIGDSRGYYNVENSIVPAAYNYLYLKKYFEGVRNVEDLRANLKKGRFQYVFINVTEVTGNIRKGRFQWMDSTYLNLLRELAEKSVVIGEDSQSVIVRL